MDPHIPQIIDIFTREQAIARIAATFPADGAALATRLRGERLLQQARNEAHTWRNESDAVLFRYAELCEAEQQRLEREAKRIMQNQGIL